MAGASGRLEAVYDNQKRIVAWKNQRGEHFPLRGPDDSMTVEAAKVELERMRQAAENAGLTGDYVATMDYAERYLLRDRTLDGFQKYDAFVDLFRPLAMRDPEYVKEVVRAKTVDGKEHVPSDEAAQAIASRYASANARTQQQRIDKLRRELLDRKRRAQSDAVGKRGGRVDMHVDDAEDVRDFRPDARVRVTRRNRKGSVFDAVRSAPARLKKSLGLYVRDEDRRLGTYEDEAAKSIADSSEKRYRNARDFTGPTEESFVNAPYDEKGRVVRGSKRDFLDRGHSEKEAEKLAKQAYEKKYAGEAGSIAWFVARGVSEERAKRLSELAYKETAGAQARKTGNKSKFAKSGKSVVGSEAYWREHYEDVSAREAEALSEVAFRKSYRQTGTVTSEAARGASKGLWGLATAPFRAAGRVAKRGTDAAQRAVGERGGAKETVKAAVRAEKRATAHQASEFKKEFEKGQKGTRALEKLAEKVGPKDSVRAKAAGATATAVGSYGSGAYATTRRSIQLVPGVVLTRGVTNTLAAVAKKEGVAEEKDSRAKLAWRGLKVVSGRAATGLVNAYKRASLATRLFIALGVLILLISMPIPTAKFAVHAGLMLIYAAADFLLLAPVNAILQLLWFFYDLFVNLFLNLAINGLVGLVHSLLIVPLTDGLRSFLGFDITVFKPTFDYVGTKVPQLAYLGVLMKAGAFFPDTVPVDGFGNVQLGPDLEDGFHSYVTWLPPEVRNPPKNGDAEVQSAWLLHRLENSTGCYPSRGDDCSEWKFDVDPDSGELVVDFTEGAALFPDIIIPPRAGLQDTGGVVAALVPSMQWYAWNDEDRNGVMDEDEFVAVDKPWDAYSFTQDSITFDPAGTKLGQLISQAANDAREGVSSWWNDTVVPFFGGESGGAQGAEAV